MRFSDEVNLVVEAIKVFVGSHAWTVVQPAVQPVIDAIIGQQRRASNPPYSAQPVQVFNADKIIIYNITYNLTNGGANESDEA